MFLTLPHCCPLLGADQNFNVFKIFLICFAAVYPGAVSLTSLSACTHLPDNEFAGVGGLGRNIRPQLLLILCQFNVAVLRFSGFFPLFRDVI